MMEKIVDSVAIREIYPLIAPHIRRTPILKWNVTTWLKLELTQHAGSFKARGAFANLLTRELPGTGIAAASGGNHGVAVAYAAMKLSISARIFVPTISSAAKIARIRATGADLVVTGNDYGDALAACEEYVAKTGALSVHAFDAAETMLGQGSVALELEEQAPELDTVLVPVGGGGLIGGIAAWYGARVKVIGVEPELSPTLHHALAAGGPVDAPVGGIAADSLAPRRVGEQVFPICKAHVERVLLVSDGDIRSAQQALWDGLRIAAEPGGATAFAALNSARYAPRADERIGIVISGGNTTAVDFSR